MTNVDKAAEALIIETIPQILPAAHHYHPKPGEHAEDQDVHQWVIDPLDGTTSFVKRLPQLLRFHRRTHTGRTEVAVVYDPMRNEDCSSATRGQGAQLNGYRLRGSQRSRPGWHVILATGFRSKAKQHAIGVHEYSR